MPAAVVGQTPSLHTFLKSLKQIPVDNAIELLVSLLKRRQIRSPRACALATAQLLLRVVSSERVRTPQALIQKIRDVGRRLVTAQPQELTVGNIVRRVLGVIREIAEDEQDPSALEGLTRPGLPGSMSGLEETSDSIVDLRAAAQVPTVQGELSASSESGHAPKSSSHGNQLPPSTSLFGLFQHPDGSSGLGSPPPGASSSPSVSNKSSNKLGGKPATKEKLDVKAEVIEGIKELLDELDQVDTQIADFALDHINSNETILTHTSSQTVQKFLLTAAKKRKFTVIHAEAYPNDHEATHATILHGGYEDPATGGGVDPDDLDDDNAASRWKPLTSLGIQVILIPDSAVFALMSRINKVLLAPNAILADGSLLAAAGAASIAQAAQVHHVPVVVLGGVYKLSPVYPFSSDEMIEYGDPGKVVPYGGSGSGEFLDKVDVVNPLYDWTPAEAVDLYITNLGGHAPSYLYRIVDDHYYAEDTDLVTRG